MFTFLQKWSLYQRLAFVIIGLFLVVNLWNIHDYGITWDEPVQHTIGLVQLQALFSGFNPLTKLHGDLLYYGPFYEMLNQLLFKFLVFLFDLDVQGAFAFYVPFHHVLGVLFGTLALGVLFYFARTLFNDRAAFFSVLFFSLFPHFVSHTHYNTKDIPLMVLLLLVFYFFYLALVKQKKLFWLLSGAFFGLALATKINALLFFPIVFFIFLGYYSRQLFTFSFWKSSGYFFSLFLGIALFVLFLVWPSLWYQPSLLFQSISYFLHHSWSGNILYLGEMYAAGQQPWHYPFVYIFAVTPFLIFLFFILGLVLAFYSSFNKKDLRFLFLLSWFFVPLLILLKPGIIVYDGIRHFFLVVPVLILFAGYGIDWFIRSIELRFISFSRFVSLISFLFVVFLLLPQLISVHPYQGSYFNEVVRTIYPSHLEKTFEVEYWGASYREGVDWLNTHASPDAVVCVPLAGHLLQFYSLRADLRVACQPQKNVDYVMFFTRTQKDFTSLVPSAHLVYAIQRYDSDLLYIYAVS